MADKATIDTYDKYARVYDEEVVYFWEHFPRDFLDAFVSNLPGDHILDVGSGSGRDAVLLRDRGLEVICVDASKSMIEMTSKLGFDSHLADFSQMKFQPESFDGIWAYNSLIHVPKAEAEQAIERLRTFIKPGGSFAISVREGDFVGMHEQETMPGTARFFKKYTSQELKELIEPLGFSFLTEGRYKPSSNTYLHQIYRIS